LGSRNRALALLFTLSCTFLTKAQSPPPEVPESQRLHRRPIQNLDQARKADRHITLNVVVTDTSDKPVPGLQQSDFQILDNGQPQKIASFRAIAGRTTQPPVEVILLLDTMNPSFQDVAIERQGIDKFLHQNDGRLTLPVSIVFLADSGVKINQASLDGNALATDLAKLQTPIRTFEPAQGSNGWLERMQRSIRTLTQLTTYESTRPGRKLLLWIGPGWPLMNGPTSLLTAQDQMRFFNSIVDVTNNLRKVRMTLYSVAPLNLSQGTGLRNFAYQNFLKGIENASQANSPNLAVQVLSYQSGGLVLGQSGDLATQINRCIADADAYYEISFDAGPAVGSTQYHKLEIKLQPPNLIARTNKGFYLRP